MPTGFSIPWSSSSVQRQCWGPIANVSSIGVYYRWYFTGFCWVIRPWYTASSRHLPCNFFTPVDRSILASAPIILILAAGYFILLLASGSIILLVAAGYLILLLASFSIILIVAPGSLARPLSTRRY
jgi:hypothetical protein